jgi:hypothetical protein
MILPARNSDLAWEKRRKGEEKRRKGDAALFYVGRRKGDAARMALELS